VAMGMGQLLLTFFFSLAGDWGWDLMARNGGYGVESGRRWGGVYLIAFARQTAGKIKRRNGIL